jgi:HEAT repeat protein
LLLLLAGCGRASPDEVVEAQYGPSIQQLIEGLQSEDHKVRLEAAIILGEKREAAKEALPAMIRALKDSHWGVRYWVATGLSWVDPTGQEVQVALCDATRDSDSRVRIAAVKSLGRIGAPAWHAVDELEPLLLDEEIEVRRAVIQTIGFIGPGAQKMRSKLLIIEEYDPDETNRALAHDALIKIGN